ncbi:MAG TPA: hypothetical protein VFW73_06595 [Lacipirellulaceae bacterium]|nr:hypothetical protein [Lacipirellulaceae bacterium]
MTASYAGSIKTDRQANSIQFLSGSTIDANSNGDWKPLADGSDGSATADYGGKATFLLFVTVNFAGRNLVAGLTSGALTINGSGQFDLSTTDVAFASGALSYRGPGGDPVGSASIAGEDALMSGTGVLSSLVQGAQTTETLTLPVDSTFVLQPDSSTTINLTLTGQLVASSTFATPLAGDYNNNGVVDAGDYVLWRKKFGSGTSLPNDDTAGVGLDDYARWRSHFGDSLSASGSGGDVVAGSAVPEAPTFALCSGALVFVGLGYRRGL